MEVPKEKEEAAMHEGDIERKGVVKKKRSSGQQLERSGPGGKELRVVERSKRVARKY